jgi:hypothetical protein
VSDVFIIPVSYANPETGTALESIAADIKIAAADLSVFFIKLPPFCCNTILNALP